MLKIRLSRGGTKKKPFYRVVVVDKKQKINGPAKEILGYWDPKNKQLKIDEDKYLSWRKKGALVSEKVSQLITNHGKALKSDN